MRHNEDIGNVRRGYRPKFDQEWGSGLPPPEVEDEPGYVAEISGKRWRIALAIVLIAVLAVSAFAILSP